MTECEWCGREIYNDDRIYNGAAVCPECYDFAMSLRAIIDFIESYPNEFLEYLRKSDSTDIAVLLEDYREQNGDSFDKWLASCGDGNV